MGAEPPVEYRGNTHGHGLNCIKFHFNASNRHYGIKSSMIYASKSFVYRGGQVNQLIQIKAVFILVM